ncbi:MAG TPA: glycosyltransferase family 2 protein, partial [Actinomycetota bacterium]|nr:glycosyltransferase family 2 protein [Actinomycetota bacterium]
GEPLVSIVTPCRDAVDMVGACIESIRTQSYPNIEHIVIDAASTDGTVELLEGHEQITWVSEPDSGQSNALNKGFAMAKGEYLAWLGADDLLKPRSVEWTVRRLFAAGSGIAYGDVEFVEPGRTYIVKPPARLSSRSFEMFNPIWQPGTVFTAEAFKRVGGIDETYNLAMDFDLWLRMVDAGITATYVPETLATYVVHDASKTGALNREDFIIEMFRSYLRSGRVREASLALGRAAANAAHQDGVVDVAATQENLDRYISMLDPGRELSLKIARAGAWAEASVLELQRSVRGLRHVLRLSPWLVGPTRRRLLLAARRGLTRGRLAVPDNT